MITADRTNALQKYLEEMQLIPMIRESLLFKKFLDIDKHFPDEVDRTGGMNKVS